MSKCYIFTEEELTSLADTIRIKAGTENKMTMSDMCETIRNMDSGSSNIAKYGITTIFDFGDLTVTGILAKACKLFKKYTGLYITTISANAFQSSSVEEFSFPAVTLINNYAFDNCTELTEVEIPANVTSVGTYAFRKCTKLRKIEFKCQFTSLSSNMFTECSKLEEVILPTNLTSIGSYAFSLCSLLESLDLPDSITTINSYAFNNCKKLKLSKLPSNLTTIATYAFRGIGNEEVVIPSSVTSIGTYAFAECSSLKTIYIKPTLSSLPVNVFSSDSSITDIYVPWAEGAVANAPWGATNATVHYQTDFNQNITSISVDNGEISRKSGKSYKVDVIYSPDKNFINPSQIGVTYAITSGSEYATIDENGLVTLTQTVLPSTTITVNVTSTYNSSITATATITAIDQSYSVDLNNQWVSAGSISSNPLYKSNNYHLASSVAKMYVTIKAYDRFAIAIRANSESSDKAYIGKLDVVDANAVDNKCVLVEYGSSGSDYEMHVFEELNGEQHRIEIGYVKDGSTDRYDDRAYVYFPSTNILTSISLTGDSVSNGKSGSTHQLTVEYNPSYCDPELKGVTYSVTTNNATVDQNGLVTLTQDLTAGDVITVRATSTYNSSIYADHSISVISLSNAKVCMFLDDDCIYSKTSTHIDYNGNYEYQPNTVMAKYGASDTTNADIDSIGEGDYLMFTMPSWRRPDPMPSSFTMSDIINNWGLDGGGVVHDSPAWGCYVGNLGLVYGVQGISTVGTYPDTGEDYCVYIDEPMGSVLHLFTRSGEAEYAKDFFIAAVVKQSN